MSFASTLKASLQIRQCSSWKEIQKPQTTSLTNNETLEHLGALCGTVGDTMLSLLEGAHHVTPQLRLVYILISIGLVVLAGLMSGLTLGLMSMDAVDLEVRCSCTMLYQIDTEQMEAVLSACVAFFTLVEDQTSVSLIVRMKERLVW